MGVSTLNRAVFLDRDGVVNQAVIRQGKPYPPASADEVRVVDGAANGLAALQEAGFLLLVITNQPDVARGMQSLEQVQAIHRKLEEQVPITEFFVCPHDSADRCECRKPKPGLIHAAARRHDVDLHRSYLIGDRWRDMDAAQSAGVRGVWIDYKYDEQGPAAPPAATVASLPEAVRWILEQEKAS